MDIYQRRRLTAVGVLVAFISVIAIAAGNGGGDDSTAPLETGGASGATGAAAAGALTKPDYIAQADQICATANSQVAGATGVGTAVPDPGVKIRSRALKQLEALQAPTKKSADLSDFLAAYKSLVAGAKARENANKVGDTNALATAQTKIDTATNKIETSGTAYGFRKCNSLSATGGASASSGTTDTGAAAATGTTTPTDTGAAATATPPADAGAVAPPADTGTATPPADTGSDTGGSGGIAP